MKKEKRGDWPEELDVLDDEEAARQTHDTPGEPQPEEDDVVREMEDKERREGHPADSHNVDDPGLD